MGVDGDEEWTASSLIGRPLWRQMGGSGRDLTEREVKGYKIIAFTRLSTLHRHKTFKVTQKLNLLHFCFIYWTKLNLELLSRLHFYSFIFVSSLSPRCQAAVVHERGQLGRVAHIGGRGTRWGARPGRSMGCLAGGRGVTLVNT